MHFKKSRPSEGAIELGRVVERGLRESRAIDTEALCIVAGEMVFHFCLFLFNKIKGLVYSSGYSYC